MPWYTAYSCWVETVNSALSEYGKALLDVVGESVCGSENTEPVRGTF